MPAADVTYTAVFEVNKYKLTFDVDGVKTESEVEYDAAITKPADPTKEGYTFAGWDAEVLAKMPDQALTYTATWLHRHLDHQPVHGEVRGRQR